MPLVFRLFYITDLGMSNIYIYIYIYVYNLNTVAWKNFWNEWTNPHTESLIFLGTHSEFITWIFFKEPYLVCILR